MGLAERRKAMIGAVMVLTFISSFLILGGAHFEMQGRPPLACRKMILAGLLVDVGVSLISVWAALVHYIIVGIIIWMWWRDRNR